MFFEKGVEEENAFYRELVEQCLEVHEEIRVLSDPMEIGRKAFHAINDFYQGDWCGVFVADLVEGEWRPDFWMNEQSGFMAPTHFQDCEYSIFFSIWGNALNTMQPIIMTDREEIRKKYPLVYESYCRLHCKSIMAIPFNHGSKGFLLVRNAKRYNGRAELLQMLLPIIIVITNEKRTLEIRERKTEQCCGPEENEIFVQLLGQPTIKGYLGEIDDSQLTSTNAWQILTYFLCVATKAVDGPELVRFLKPDILDEEVNRASRALRNHIYKLQDFFKQISGQNVILNNRSGYYLNPDYRFVTDFGKFKQLCRDADNSSSMIDQIDLYEKAVELYRGDFFTFPDSPQKLKNMQVDYHRIYMEALFNLIQRLDTIKDYKNLEKYASMGQQFEPSRMVLFYWRYVAHKKQKEDRMAKTVLNEAKAILPEIDYYKLVMEITKECE